MRLLIFLYPWLELFSLIQLGVETSALFAIAWVVVTLLLGGALLRRVGKAGLQRLREAQQTGVLRQHIFLDEMAMAGAGLLLIVPGLISDFLAIIVLSGPPRRALARLLGLTMTYTGARSATERNNDYTIEGSFEVVDDDSDPDRPRLG